MNSFKTLNRRGLLAGVAAAGLMASPAFAQEQKSGPVDVKELMTPPAIGEMSIGKPDAKVVVVEYASASCPHCAEFYKDVFPSFTKEYIDTGKVMFIFREFPHNDPAMGAFMLARCAPKEKYFPLIDAFFNTQEQWVADPLNGLKNIALQAGFTEQTFNACLANQDVAKGIFEVRTRGEGFGVKGIPTFFINGVRYEGENTLAGMKAVIDPLLG